jgi:predicted glycogen debranching enzyme
MPFIDFGRDICGNLANSASREWLVTNGIGGFASGTVAGMLTRRYHGLLVAALQPPLGRTLLVTKLDETVHYSGRSYPLFTNRWGSGNIDPAGFLQIERFHLEGTTPVWTFACADALIEKRIWMQSGANTTYVQYYLPRATAPITLTAKIFVNYRDVHGATRGGWEMQIDPISQGIRVAAFEGAVPFHILSDRGEITPRNDWYSGFSLSVEQYRGFEGLEDHLYAGELNVSLQPGEIFTLIASTDAEPNLDSAAAFAERQTYERSLLNPFADRPAGIQQLVLAADQFVVRRATPGGTGAAEPVDGHTILAGYHWFGDWGRDTMISLPGLTLSTSRPEVARSILLTFSRFVDKGMLPNRFPNDGETPEYNTVDATLWYFEALRAYHAVTGDDELLRQLFPVLEDIIRWHRSGTRYHIHVDPEDNLLSAGEPGVQLTWMDAKVGDWVVTPRIGKPVEINALWYHALRVMADFALQLGKPGDEYAAMAADVQANFSRFWCEVGGYCYDVIDGPSGKDTSLRPNQLLAVSLPHSPLPPEQQKAVVDACARHLLTSHGLRSLASNHPAYTGRYGGDFRQRDGAYHQGTVWSWLIGPFVDAHLRVYKDPEMARSFLRPLVRHLADHGLGSVSEIFDGDPPFSPRGCIAQAWGVAELLRAWQGLAEAASA